MTKLYEYLEKKSYTAPNFNSIQTSQHIINDTAEETVISSDFHKDEPEGLYGPNDLAGFVIGISYTNSKGESSDREIVIRRVSYKDDGDATLYCYCFTAEGPRQFLLSRIEAVYDDDGVLTEPETFFNSYQLSCKWQNNPKVFGGYEIIRDKFKSEIQILTAMGRADSRFKVCELEEIIQYLVLSAENVGIFCSEHDIQQLKKYLKRLYPDTQSTLLSLRRLTTQTQRHREKLFQAISQVMYADNILHDNEFDLSLEIAQLLDIHVTAS